MVQILALWLPILVAAVFVFVASSIIHMFLGYHRNDFAKIDGEDALMDALRPRDLAPGDYFFPHAGGPEVMRSEAYQAKLQRGPVAFLTVADPGAFTSMGKNLAQWFVYCVVVGAVVAYVTGGVLEPGAAYPDVFGLSCTVAFCCYAFALPLRSIWYHQKWSTTLKSMFDGVVYALLTAGTFGWLWPG